MSTPPHIEPLQLVDVFAWRGFVLEVDRNGMCSTAAVIDGYAYRICAPTLGELTEALIRRPAKPLPWRAHA